MYLFKNKRWNKVVPFKNKQGVPFNNISYLYNRLVLRLSWLSG